MPLPNEDMPLIISFYTYVVILIDILTFTLLIYYLAPIIFDSFFFSSLRLNTLANLNTALTTRDEDELDQDLASIRKVP